MWERQLLGVDLYHILNWLILYSFAGWVWESSYVSIKEHRLVNRGFVTGPVCTIYGFGAVSAYLLLHPFSGNLVLLYIGGVIVPTILEYLTSVLMEKIFHTRWWDYTKNKYNFQGRICLGASLGWGFFTVILFKILHPAVEGLVDLYSVETGKLFVMLSVFVYAIDFGMSYMNAMQIGEKLRDMDAVMDELYELSARLEARIDAKIAFRPDIQERMAALRQRYEQQRMRGNIFVRRAMNAYPHMKSSAQALKERAKNKLKM